MKNSGFFKVLQFSYVQLLKSKTTKITLIILVILSLLSYPVITLISGSFEKTETETALQKVYITVDDELYKPVTENIEKIYEQKVDFERVSDDKYDSLIKELVSKKENSIYLVVDCDTDVTSESFGIYYKIIYDDGDNASDKADRLLNIISECCEDITLEYCDVSEEQAKQIESSNMNIKMFDAKGNEIKDNTGLSMIEYNFTYVILFVLIIIISFSGSAVAEGIVSEKANKVIEYIMVNIKPMELILGKVVSGIAYLLTIMLSVFVSLITSSYINKVMFDSNGKTLFDTVNELIEEGVMSGLNIGNVIVAIVVIVAGIYFFGIVGGLSGGMVSKVEEMGEGLKIYSFLMVIGAYAALGLCMSASVSGSGWGAISYVVYLLPISSVFIVPSYLLLGKISVIVALGSLAILIVSNLLLTWLAGRIFGQMLYHNGSVLKIKDIVRLTKDSRKSK